MLSIFMQTQLDSALPQFTSHFPTPPSIDSLLDGEVAWNIPGILLSTQHVSHKKWWGVKALGGHPRPMKSRVMGKCSPLPFLGKLLRCPIRLSIQPSVWVTSQFNNKSFFFFFFWLSFLPCFDPSSLNLVLWLILLSLRLCILENPGWENTIIITHITLYLNVCYFLQTSEFSDILKP